MGERLRFGVDTPESIQQTKPAQLATMFPGGEDLPLFSGTPIPAIDYERVLQADQARRQRHHTTTVAPAADIFTAPIPAVEAPKPASTDVQQ